MAHLCSFTLHCTLSSESGYTEIVGGRGSGPVGRGGSGRVGRCISSDAINFILIAYSHDVCPYSSITM